MRRQDLSEIERLMSKVKPESAFGCWNWTGAIAAGGYGFVRWRGSTKLAHRMMYEKLVGPIPEGMHLDHLCRNRRCCNPEHLEVVTPAENSSRQVSFNGSKTHCHRGHEFTPENTYRNKAGRKCRICDRASKRAYKKRDPERTNAQRRAYRARRRAREQAA